jgi:hypothetical protein
MTRTTRLLLGVAAVLLTATAWSTPVTFFRDPIDTVYPSTAFPNVRYPVDVAAGDMDGDTDIDVVATVGHFGGTGEGVYWYRNSGSSTFTKTLIDTTLGDSDLDGVRLDVGDIDDDLDRDIVLVGANTLFLYKNGGAGTFTRTTINNTTGALRLAKIADLDGDTDEDVALLANSGIFWLQNDGSENFTRFTIDANPVVDGTLTVVNLDGDADIDVIAETLDIPSGNRYFAWYENIGGGVFIRHVFDVLLGTEDISDVFVADIDRDGLLDLAVTKTDDNDVWWYEDSGGHVYVPHVVTTAFSVSPRRVWVTDFDNDTYLDIVVVGGNGPTGEVAYWQNDGEQNFTYHNIEATGGNRQGLFVIDIDNDTLDDVLVTRAVPSDLVIFRNNGTGTAVATAPRAASLDVRPNYPNPFNPSTTIAFDVSPAGEVEVDVFGDGAKVRTLLHEPVDAGAHEVRWDGRDDRGRRVASGVYVARVRAHGISRTHKMVLLM